MARARNYYYNSCHERWIVSKVIDGKKTHFGSYRNEETAKRVVEELKKINWDKTQFWKIKTKLELGLC